MGKGSGDNCRQPMTLDAAVEPQHSLIASRRADVEDLPAMFELKLQVTSRIYADLAGAEKLAEWQRRFCSEDYFIQRLNAADNEFFSVERGARIVAMAALKVRNGKAYMGDLYCAEDGRGWGQQLAAQRLARAQEMGLPGAVCDVFSTNQRALRFVRKQGYTVVDGYTEQSFGVHVHRLAKTL